MTFMTFTASNPFSLICSEPVYKEVAEEVAKQKLNVYVTRIDCTRFSNVATEFSIRGFPTVMFIKPNRIVEFLGDRNAYELLDFAKRLSGPPVRALTSCDQLETLKDQHRVFFVHFGDNRVWTNYTQAAVALQATDWFYFGNMVCPNYQADSVYAMKSSLGKLKASKFPLFNLEASSPSAQLIDWIKVERFPKFIRASLGNLHQLMTSNKILVIAMLENDPFAKQSNLTSKERRFFEKLEQLANQMTSDSKFLFVWTSQLDLINSIVVSTVAPLPAFVLINTTDSTNHIVVHPKPITQIELILKSIEMDQRFKPIFVGGNGFGTRIARMGYDTYVAVNQMFQSNPILTTILFGLPCCLVSFLIYCSCFTDFLEGTDEEFMDEEDEDEAEDRDLDSDCSHKQSATPNHLKSE
jgi:thioredoxin domain-containing protein 10